MYPVVSDIEAAWRASGAGVCVIVEGETELDDAWFYRQWFDDRAREVTFFPQNGWLKVIDAVAVLRQTLGARRVYGIIDRDFEPDVTYPPMPDDGILRTAKYTLENYLLDSECWFHYVRPHTRRNPKPGWNTFQEAKSTIENLYRECIPLAAYNMILRYARSANCEAFAALQEADKTYREHPQSLANMENTAAHLRQIQTQMGLADDLGQKYTDLRADIENSSLPDLEQVVSGKYVLKLLSEQFPLKLSGKQAWDDVLGAYVDACPDPPPDLQNLVNLILQDAC